MEKNTQDAYQKDSTSKDIVESTPTVTPVLSVPPENSDRPMYLWL